MLFMNHHLKFHVYRHPTDMRKSFDGLCGLVQSEMARNPLDGEIYVFINRRRNRMKLLFWERGGFWLLYKRLEAGTFESLKIAGSSKIVTLNYESLLMLSEGIDMSHIKRRRRYSFQKSVA